MEFFATTQFIALSFNIFLFILGLIIGSFFNVVSLRYKGYGQLFNLKKIGGRQRSRCSYCRKKLKWYELIPLVSFVIQFGRCRSCRRYISWQYPLVELAVGFAFLLPYYFDYSLVGWVWLSATLAMILLSAIDWRLQIIPDQINLFLAGLGVVLILLGTESFLKNYGDWLSLVNNIWWDRLLAAFIAMLFFAFIILASKGKAMGVGDLKLAGALGLLLGWPDIILALSIAFILGAILGVIFIVVKGKKMKTAIPFGPFMVAGVFIHILFGYQIANWYFTLMIGG